MNKAFVREPDDVDARCPACGIIGLAVPRKTVESHLPAEAARGLSDSAYFCANPRCTVAYYDALEQTVATSLLTASVFPKDPAAPVCSCHGLTAADIEADAHANRPQRLRELIAKSKLPGATERCEALAANGVCCVAEAQRLYMKSRGAG